MGTKIRGHVFMAGFAAAIAVVAVFGFLMLQKAAHLRFAISIHAVPESPYKDLVPLGRPILVRVDKASAGRSPLKAVAVLLDGDGRTIAGIRPLVVGALPSGKPTESVEFPPLSELPGQRLLAAAVIRLPADTPEAREQVEHALQTGVEKKPSLPRVFSHVLEVVKRMGGHAELTQVEVRQKL